MVLDRRLRPDATYPVELYSVGGELLPRVNDVAIFATWPHYPEPNRSGEDLKLIADRVRTDLPVNALRIGALGFRIKQIGELNMGSVYGSALRLWGAGWLEREEQENGQFTYRKTINGGYPSEVTHLPAYIEWLSRLSQPVVKGLRPTL